MQLQPHSQHESSGTRIPPSPLPLHQASSTSYFLTSSSKYVGQLIYPPVEASARESTADKVTALGLVEEPPVTTENEISTNRAELDKAVEVAVNGKFGLVATGTQRYLKCHHPKLIW